MPNYDYECDECGCIQTRFVSFENREKVADCDCGGVLHYTFPVDAFILGPMEPYHDEVLGVDIHGRRERAQILRAEGAIEAGDPVHGSRNFEEKHAFGVAKANGRRYSDFQREKEDRSKKAQEAVFATINRDGSETVMQMKDASSNTKKAIRATNKTGRK